MVRYLGFITFLLVFFTSCKENNELFILPNLPKGNDIPVVLKRIHFNEIIPNKVPVFYFLDKTIPAQADDLDGDGIWDEIALSISTQEKENLALSLKWEDKMPDFIVRTNVRMGISETRDYKFVDTKETVRPKGHLKEEPPRLYQMEGPAWENDKVAFRAYFDSRNGKDIFGKRVLKMILDSVGLKNSNYHTLANWGMDILKVGNSLGAGALAIKYHDSIYRLENSQKEIFKIITEGAVRSIFEMQYEGFKVSDLSLNITEKITIWAGRNGFQSEIIINGTNKPIQLITGFANFRSTDLIKNEIDDFSYFATHDNQSENNDMLGMAIITKKENLISVNKSPKEGKGITNTFYGVLNYSFNEPVKFWFVTGWQLGNSKFETKEGFLQMLHNEIKALDYEL